MGSLGLPSRNSPDLRLVVATPKEIEIQQHANSVEWQGALPLEAYLRREKVLFNQELTKDGGLTAWMLVYQPDPNGERQVLCGCESINKRALVARNGKVEEVICHGVGSVFCPEDFRGRGYAGRMMEELGERLKQWQTDNGKQSLFSVLFSDIGKEFYAARGWHPFLSSHIILPAVERPLPEGVRLLKSTDLPDLCALDERLLHERLSQVDCGDRSTVAIVPDSLTAQWHHAREDFVATELYGKTPVVKGAMVGSEPGHRVWAYWTRVWANPQEEHPNTLHILRLVIEDDSLSDFAPATSEGVQALQDADVTRAISAILTVAQSEAARWDMKEVSMWNPTSAGLAAAQLIDPQVTVEHRETDSIASLRWYGSGSWEDIDWVCNEKYGWC